MIRSTWINVRCNVLYKIGKGMLQTLKRATLALGINRLSLVKLLAPFKNRSKMLRPRGASRTGYLRSRSEGTGIDRRSCSKQKAES